MKKYKNILEEIRDEHGDLFTGSQEDAIADLIQLADTHVLVAKDDLEALVDYNYEDEYEDWQDQDEPTEGHIYLVLEKLSKQLREQTKTETITP